MHRCHPPWASFVFAQSKQNIPRCKPQKLSAIDLPGWKDYLLSSRCIHSGFTTTDKGENICSNIFCHWHPACTPGWWKRLGTTLTHKLTRNRIFCPNPTFLMTQHVGPRDIYHRPNKPVCVTTAPGWQKHKWKFCFIVATKLSFAMFLDINTANNQSLKSRTLSGSDLHALSGINHCKWRSL